MDKDRFKLEVLPMKNKLYRFASGLLNDTEEAQDAVQEVFIKLWGLRSKLHTLNSTEAFVMKVTRNHCLDRIKARRTVSIEQTKSLVFTEAKEESIEKEVEVKDSVKFIRQLMDKLPEQQKMIMQLRDIEGCEFEEIEQSLDISINTIRVNLSRARKKLRELYLNSVDHGFEKNKSFTG